MKIKTKPKAIKLVAAVLSFLMINSVLPFFAVTASAAGITPTTPQKDTGGVYQIGTAAELYWFADKVNNDNANYGNASAVLTADITVNSGLLSSLKFDENKNVTNGNSFESWTPIGDFSNNYTGKFDGQGHTVSGLYFNDTYTEFVGLFGYLAENGEIKNVGVIDSYFNGPYSVGSVCGYNWGTITGCYSTGTVSGSGDNVGGVCGWNDGTITGCYNTGAVSGSDYVSGVCGWNNGTITGCYNTGTVSGSDSVGGVCGYNNGTMTGCYTNNGGVYGMNEGNVTDCEVKSDSEFKDGTVCKLLNTALKNENSDVRFYQGVKSPEFIRTPQLVNNVYQISCASELYGFAQLVNNGEKSANAVLTADIVVNTGVLNDSGKLNTGTFTSWTPIGNNSNKYTGTFDGQGHTVSGLYFNNTNYVGLFGYLGSGGEIKNVGVIDSYFKGNEYVGGVCGYNEGTIIGCYNTGAVSGFFNVGGVCGVNNGTITGCYNTGTASGYSDVGGVCGYNWGTITGCYNTGTISGNSSVGGVCGYNNKGALTGCYTNNGGVYGYNSNGTVRDCVEYTGDKFVNGTVCKLLNNAFRNQNFNLRFYQGANYPELIKNVPTLVDGVYQISNKEELYAFAQLVNIGETSVSAVLTADIVVNTGVLNDNGTVADDTSGFTSWTPIGNDSNRYTDKFDGQGHTISGLYFNNTNTNYVGLFGFLGKNGEIKNVGVIDSYFNGNEYVGGVCGYNNINGTITGCYNTGTVSGSDKVGGVCGYNNGTITGCYNTGTVSGTNSVGGMCGYNTGNGTITGCYNSGTVSGSQNVGGVCGYNNISTITGCYNTGSVNGRSHVGGVCGYSSINGKITASYNTGTVSGDTRVGGVCGYNSNGTLTGCYTNRDGDTNYRTDTEFADGTVCKLLNTALQNANSDVRFYQGVKSPEFIRTPQLVNNVYQISCASELYGFAQLVNSKTEPSANAVLTADIVVNTGVLKDDGNVADDTSGFTSWTPIGKKSNKYTGTFDGQGHTVSGLYFNNTNTNYVGLFGYLNSGGEIKNIGVIDSYFKGSGYVGGVCGYNNGTITGCYNTGTFRCSGHYVGGVCGRNYGTITGCYNTGTVNGTVSAGGVCGRNENGKITDCYNTGTVRGSGDKIGGVCGLNYGTISNCYNTGTVIGYDDYVGGVCGWNINTGTTTGCYNTGTVSGSGNNVGGVCGSNSGTMTGCYTNSGGVCGVANGTVTDCVEYTGDEFKDGTVCTQLNTALKNANYEVRFCQRIGTDASPLLTYQFESIDEHTVDTYTVDNNTFKAICFCEQKSEKTMDLTLKTEKAVVANGADNTLTATLSNYDNEAVTYKWYQDAVEIENATSSTYKMPKDLTTGTHTYKVDVTMENIGTITQSVDVLVDITPQYYVEIPASVDIGDSFTVSANNVLLKNNAQLKVSLISDFTLSTAKGSSLNYEILNNSIKLNSGDTLLTVAGTENPTAPGSGTSDTYNVALAQGEKPKYSGNYTDNLTFTIKVEP